MNIRDYGHVARRWWPLLLALVLLGGAVGGLVGKSGSGQSRGTTRIFVSNGEADNVPAAQSTLGMQRMATYASLVRSTRLSQLIVTDLGLKRDPASIAASLTPTLEQGSVVMDVQVAAGSEEEAAAILNSLPKQLGTLVTQIGASDAKSPVSFTTVDGPRTSTGTPMKSLIASTVVGLVLGAVIAGLLLVVRTRANPVLTSTETVAARSRTPVWARLPRPSSDADDQSRSLPEFHRLVQRIGVALDRPARVVGVTAARRPDRAVAAGLASAWADRGRRVLYVDTVATAVGSGAATPGKSGHYDVMAVGPTGEAATPWGAVDRVLRDAAGRYDVLVVALPELRDTAARAAWLEPLEACVLVVDEKSDRERDVLRAAADLRALTGGVTGLAVVGTRERS